MLKRWESVAGCGWACDGSSVCGVDRIFVWNGRVRNEGYMYRRSLRSISRAISIDWETSMPLMPARMLMLFGQKIDIPNM